MGKHCGNCANYRKEKNQFSEECGKCVAARLENGETTDPSHWRALPQTNADRIRAMSDEELAKILEAIAFDVYNCNECQPRLMKKVKCRAMCDNKCDRCILEWLKQPAEVHP